MDQLLKYIATLPPDAAAGFQEAITVFLLLPWLISCAIAGGLLAVVRRTRREMHLELAKCQTQHNQALLLMRKWRDKHNIAADRIRELTQLLRDALFINRIIIGDAPRRHSDKTASDELQGRVDNLLKVEDQNGVHIPDDIERLLEDSADAMALNIGDGG